MRDLRLSLVSLAIALAGCGSAKNVGTTYQIGYVANDACGTLTTQADCTAKAGCDWLALGLACAPGTTCPTGVCYAPDPCFGITDQKQCQSNSRCAWADVTNLCPAGANCSSGGFCHPADPSGCSCVTPVACPAGKDCPPPECDCTGGGSGGGGACTCNCPACPPGASCAPCACSCGGSGGGGGGCAMTGSTCTCACPSCPPGQTCPPCACGCGSGGGVPAPSPVPQPAPSPSTKPAPSPSPVPPGPAPSPSPSPSNDPCSKYTDATSCQGDTTDGCHWYAYGRPCQTGQPCVSGVCQGAITGSGGGTGGSGGGCICNCPYCPAGQACPPCACDCGGCGPTGSPGPGPSPSPGGPPSTGVVCPALGCNPNCPNGVTKDANGCPTCTCA